MLTINDTVDNKLQGLCSFSLALMVILLPFNDLPYLKSTLGEMSYEASFYPSLVFIFSASLLFAGGKLRLQFSPFLVCLVIIYILVIVSSIYNYDTIINVSQNGRSGVEKLAKQLLVFTYMMLLCGCLYAFFLSWNKNTLESTSKFASITFLLIIIYSFVEVSILYGSVDLKWLDELIRNYINIDLAHPYPPRFRSVSKEASHFGIYLSFLTPFVLRGFFLERSRFLEKFLLIFCLLFLCFSTGSRAAMIIVVTQIFLYPTVLFFTGHRKLKVMSYLICIVLFSSIFFTIFHFQSPYACKYFDSPLAMHLYHSKAINVEDPQISHYSNLGRIGSTYAAFKIGVDNLSFGIGLGQYGFVYRDYLPAWALDSPEVRQWISNSIDGYWPSVHNLYARLFAETGLFSVLLWLALLVYLILSIAWTPVTDSRLCAGPDKATILTLLVGVALSGMVVDSFRFINFWLVLAMAASWLQLNKRVE